jgi:hypothetical protein
MPDNNDVFEGQGITFMSSNMASTAPSANPPAITAPSINMNDAPANQTIPAVPASQLQPNAPAPDAGAIPAPPDPTQIAANLAGNGNLGPGAGGAAPPHPSANPSTQTDDNDLFQKMGVQTPSVTQINTNALSNGVQVPVVTAPTQPGQQPDFKAELMPIGSNSAGTPPVDAAAVAHNEQQQMLTLAYSRFSPQQIQDWQNNPIGFKEAFSMLSPSQYVPGGGLKQLYNATQLMGIANKMKNGEQISPDEQGQLNDYLNKQIEMSVRKFSWGGNIAYVGAQIPAFVAEFALSDGVGKLAQVAAVKGAAELAGEGATAAATGYVTRALTTTALMPAQYAAKYGERQLNANMAVTDKGQLILHDSTESPAQSALLAFAHTGADVAGQLMAPGIGKYIVDPVTKAVSTPIVAAAKNLSPEVTDQLYQAWKAIEPSATVSKMFTSAGWAGMVEQLGANRVSQALNASVDFANNGPTGQGEKFDQYLDALTPSKDQLMVEGGLIAIAGGIHTSTGIASALLRSKGVPAPQAAEAVDNMTAMEKDAFVSQNLQTPTSPLPELDAREPAHAMATDPTATPEQQMRADDTVVENSRAGLTPQTPEAEIMAAKTASQSAGANIIANQTAATAAANPPPVQASQSGFNAKWQTWKTEVWPALYAETINDMAPIEALTGKARAAGATVPEGQDTALTVSFTKSTPEWIKRNVTQNTTTWDANGNQVITGKGLKPIYDDFDNMFLTTEANRDTRHQDFQDYQLARTFMEDQQKGLSNVSPQDQQFAADTMAKLAQKYGANIKYFDTFANEVGDWRNRILHNLVTSGIKTQEWYDTTVAARNHYAPTSREVAEEFPQTIGGKAIAKNVSPSSIGSLKQRGGSSLDVKDVFQQDLKNSAIIMQKSAVNKLRADIAKFASYYPDDVKVSRPAIIREGVEHTYDPKLREKLEQVGKFLGVETQRFDKNHIEINGGDKALGAFDPNTDKVLLARGTKESILTHEIGHALDKKLGLDQRLLGDQTIKAELQKLAEDRQNAKITLRKNGQGMTEFDEAVQRSPAKYMAYLKNDKEVIANFFDAWVNSPEQVAKTAPKAKAEFEKMIDENPQLAMLRDVRPSTNVASETIERPLMDMKGPKGSIPVYLDGKRNYMELSKPLEKAFSAMSPMEMGMVERFLGGIFRGSKRLLQFGATASPDFMLRHFYRAIFSSYLNTKGNSPVDFFRHAAVDIPKAIFAVVGKTEAYHEWASSSGALSTHLDITDKGLAKWEKEMYSTDSMAKWLNPIHLFQTVKEVSDYAPRVAAYEKMKRDGMSDLAAGIGSLEATGNYIRHGSLTQRINQYAPFFNDMVQGGDRFVRSLLRQSPAAFAARAVATITIPQLLLTGYYLYAADDKTREEYLEIPDWRRATFMNVKIGDTWIPLPRAFAAGHVFGALPEAVMLHLYGGNQPELKNFWLRQIAQTATSVSPVFDWTRAINPIMKAALENITNYNFFTQRPIFSGDMQKTAPSNQFNQYTSETAKLIGKMFDISPSKIDNTVYDMAAKTGKFALQLSDMGINEARKLAGQPVNQKATRPTDNPLYGGLIEQTPSGTQTQSFQEFEEHLHEAQQTQNQYKEATGADQAHFMQQNNRTLGAYPPINAANTQVNHLLHQIRVINQNTNISGDDKTVQINRLQDQITHIVQGANLRYRAQTGTGTAQQGGQP